MRSIFQVAISLLSLSLSARINSESKADTAMSFLEHSEADEERFDDEAPEAPDNADGGD